MTDQPESGKVQSIGVTALFKLYQYAVISLKHSQLISGVVTLQIPLNLSSANMMTLSRVSLFHLF